jgi:multidrug transporter EmrE-like cation transporter
VSRSSFRPFSAVRTPADLIVIVLLVGSCIVFQVVANSGFKLSTTAGTTKGFLGWQIIGNMAGFASVLTITGLLHYLPLSVVYPVSTGLTVIGLQVVASRLLFHEPISPAQWVGTVLVVAGILLIGGRR